MTGTWTNQQTKRDRLLVLLATVDTDDCVEPPGKPRPSTNYGYVWIDGRSVDAHVVACEWTHGPKPHPDLEAAHSCGKRFCVNPRHLRWATSQENQRDRDLHGTRVALCGEDAPQAKLTWEKVREIRDILAFTNRSQQSIADEYGVGQMTISLIKRNERWNEQHAYA